MDITKYNSLNEKLRICYSNLRSNDLTKTEREEILQEAKEYKTDMNTLLYL